LIGDQHLVGVETDMVGIGTQERGDIGSTRQLIEATLLDRLQIPAADAQARGNIVNREIPRDALISE
jgi:hypothetical protein